MGVTNEMFRLFSTELDRDLRTLIPEFLLILTMVMILVSRLLLPARRVPSLLLGIPMASLAALIALAQRFRLDFVWLDHPQNLPDRFSGLLSIDGMAEYLRIFLLVFLIAGLLLCRVTAEPRGEDRADFTILLIGSTLGLMFLVQAQHLLMMFVAIEMASVPSYVLAGFQKGKRTSSEASLKYVLFGAAASGMMLYGISLLTVTTGTGDLIRISQILQQTPGIPSAAVICAVGLIGVGLAFKLSAAPVHLWCPDVFTGASAPVGAFLSIASKAGAVAVSIRLFHHLAANDPSSTMLAQGIATGLMIVAMLTMTIGNLGAYRQTNVKRLLAYSTIAHAGYLLMGIATLQQEGTSAVLFYLAMYLLMNLGAFAIVSFVSMHSGSEELDGYRGLIQRWPTAAIGLSICLMSLIGLPPFAGFLAKYQLFAATVGTARSMQDQLPILSSWYWVMLGVAGLNTVLSIGYYLHWIRLMLIEPAEQSTHAHPQGRLVSAFVTLPATFLLLFGIGGDLLIQEARSLAYDSRPPKTITFISPSMPGGPIQ